MSKYTTEVRYICETLAETETSKGYTAIDAILSVAIPKIFDFDFPIFDESYRRVLCRKILMHYYTREIGAETVGLWKLWLNTRLNEIMPYYNEMYRSVAIQYDPTHTVNLTTTYHSDRIDTDDKNFRIEDVHEIHDNRRFVAGVGETVTVDGISKFSDTPQGMLEGVESGVYLTNATKNDSENRVTRSGEDQTFEDNTREYSRGGFDKNENKTTEDWVQAVVGKTGNESVSKLIMEFRRAIVNVDMMIIDELKDLFINLW